MGELLRDDHIGWTGDRPLSLRYPLSDIPLHAVLTLDDHEHDCPKREAVLDQGVLRLPTVPASAQRFRAIRWARAVRRAFGRARPEEQGSVTRRPGGAGRVGDRRRCGRELDDVLVLRRRRRIRLLAAVRSVAGPDTGTERRDGVGQGEEKPGGKADEKADSEPSGKGSPSASSSSSTPKIPATGPGTFATAAWRSGTVGKGSRVLSYKVVVEDGLTQSAADVAKQVEGILADPRGWTADGRSGFRRVSSGTADFVVRLATPGTVDAICGRYGLNTRGEVNCNVGKDVVVNLKRWLLATPVYATDVDAYRALIINHEVGHFLGHGHVTCPGAGKAKPRR